MLYVPGERPGKLYAPLASVSTFGSVEPNVIDQLLSVPVSRLASSVTSNFHVPLAFVVFNADSGVSGRNEPVKGAVPVVIDVGAVSSKTVLMKLSALPPLSVVNSTRMPP